ncbi:MAG: nucleotidyltransferase family protein [Planctomycetes bacterium]|nr:nucleotidyltransferase family protein [Planctomycetota bacterium]
MNTEFRALILASGASRRLGEPKALLEWRGETFLQRIVRVFREGGADSITVVVGGPHESALRASHLDVDWVSNPDPARGPISSVVRGLEAGVTRWTSVHPVDIPGVEPEDVAALIGNAREGSGAEPCVWVSSVDRRRAHPVLLDRSVAHLILEAPPASLRDVWRDPRVRVRHVERENHALLFDIDTPEDYARWLANR